MVRKIEYELDDVGRVSPSIEQQAGVQGDHRATTVEFKIPSALIDNIDTEEGEELKYRFDVYTGAGTYKNYAKVSPTVSPDYETVSLPLEEAVTRYGGKITVVLLIVGIRNDSTEHIVQSFPVQLKLAQKPNEGGLAGDSREELETLVVQAERARDVSRGFSEEAKGYAENAKESADRSEEIKEEIEGLNIVKTVNGKQGDVVLKASDIEFYGGKTVSMAISDTQIDFGILNNYVRNDLKPKTYYAAGRADDAYSMAGGAELGVAELRGSKQDKLVSGTNIKTINGQSILGDGDLPIGGGGGSFGYPKKIFDTTVTADNQSTAILAEIDTNGTANYTELFVRCRIYTVDGSAPFNISGKNITFQVNETDSSIETKFSSVAIITTTWNTAHSRCLYGHIQVLENSVVCETNTPTNSTNLDGELYTLTAERTGCPLNFPNFTKVKRFRVVMTQKDSPVFPIGTHLEIWAR